MTITTTSTSTSPADHCQKNEPASDNFAGGLEVCLTDQAKMKSEAVTWLLQMLFR